MTKRMKWWAAGIVLLVTGALGIAVVQAVGRTNARNADKKKDVPALEFTARDVVQLAPRTITAELLVPGTVQAVSQASVRSKVSAEVRSVSVREGDKVRAGQVLVEFDTAQLRTQLAERQAALESAKAQLVQAERTREVNAQLAKQNFISQNAFDTADATLRAQIAAVGVASAQLDQTKLMLADGVVRAPIDGLVAKRHVQPGEKVAFDAPLLWIVDLSRLEVQAQVAVSDVAQVTTGSRAEVEVEGLPDRPFTGQVERVNPSAEPGSRTINVYVGLKNENALLRAGMFARVRLQGGKSREVAALPLSAIRNDNGQAVVWVVGDGKLARRSVTLGRRDERTQFVEVLGGVDPADRVLATKFDNLKEGLAAKIIGGTPASAKMARDDDKARPAAN